MTRYTIALSLLLSCVLLICNGVSAQQYREQSMVWSFTTQPWIPMEDHDSMVSFYADASARQASRQLRWSATWNDNRLRYRGGAEVYIYLPSGDTDRVETHVYNAGTAETWISTVRQYGYDATGRHAETVLRLRTNSQDSFRRQWRYSFTRDAVGRIIQVLDERVPPFGDTTWYSANRSRYAYNLKGREILALHDEWYNGGWLPKDSILTSYTSNDTTISQRSIWRFSKKSWQLEPSERQLTIQTDRAGNRLIVETDGYIPWLKGWRLHAREHTYFGASGRLDSSVSTQHDTLGRIQSSVRTEYDWHSPSGLIQRMAQFARPQHDTFQYEFVRYRYHYEVVTAAATSGVRAPLLLRVHPVPARNALTLAVDAVGPGAYEATITDMAGRSVLTQAGVLAPSQQQLRILLSAVPEGSYVLTLRHQSGRAFSARFMVAR